MNATIENYDAHRPCAHFSPASGWMNDPNGLVYAYGYYHLFYQHFPHGLQHGPMYWGHARSRDLLNWEHLPIALCPDELGHIYSGSAIVDYRNVSGLGENGIAPLLLFFTHHRRNEQEEQVQCQSIAYSIDGGVSFQKYSGNPVIVRDEDHDFRDPKVFWHEESNAFVMAIATGKRLTFYRSENLLRWEYSGEFTAKPVIGHGGTLECPDLIRLSTAEGYKWVLLISITRTETEDWSMGYIVGNFDGKTFIPDPVKQPFRTLDGGCDNYAAVTFSGVPDGRVVMLGWMNCWDYADKIPAKDFRGAMTIPREMSLLNTADGFCLAQTPSAEMCAGLLDNTIQLGGKDGVMCAQIKSTPFVVNIEHEYADFTVILKNDRDSLLITFDAENKCITCDRSNCGNNEFSPLFTGILRSPISRETETVDMQIIVDVTSAEIFAMQGETVITVTFFVDEPFCEAVLESCL